jgi:hypothetical protein
MVLTHKDCWLSVYSWRALREAVILEQKAEIEYIALKVKVFRFFVCQFLCRWWSLGFSHHVTKVCYHISEEGTASTFITCTWPPVHISLLVKRGPAVFRTLITPLVLHKPFPVLPLPQLLIGQNFLKPSCTTRISSSYICSIRLQQLVTMLIEAVCCFEMLVHSTRWLVQKPWKDNHLMSNGCTNLKA